MSDKYYRKFGDKVISKNEMKAFLHTDFGPSLTEKSHARECDVNHIIKKYDKTGLISHVNQMVAEYGDVSSMDYKQMLDTVNDVRQKFESMPVHIRNRFRNDPGNYLSFMENGMNRDEAIRLGLISADKPPDNDGIGEIPIVK